MLGPEEYHRLAEEKGEGRTAVKSVFTLGITSCRRFLSGGLLKIGSNGFYKAPRCLSDEAIA